LARFSLKNTFLLILASVSHVGALVFWTQAFQHAKAGKIGIVQYSQLIYSMIVDLLIFNIEFTLVQTIGMVIVFIASFGVAVLKL
jgi:drug/metabolite transporter (DMT)-like permease